MNNHESCSPMKPVCTGPILPYDVVRDSAAYAVFLGKDISSLQFYGNMIHGMRGHDFSIEEVFVAARCVIESSKKRKEES